jgi:hypothetical protein
MKLIKNKDNKIKVYCINCLRFNKNSCYNLCEIPDCGLPFDNRYEYTHLDKDFQFDKAKGVFINHNQIFDKKGQKFIKKRLSKIRTSSINEGTIIGHPSNLNYDNNCYFYKSKIK